jgi:Domain of unknown function (DUF5671)
MLVTIITLVALLFLVGIVSGIRFIYSVASSHKQHTMQSDIKTKALDIFVYLGIAISLIVSITNVIQILFLAIERRFVDVLSATQYYADSSQSDARFAIASLVVMFPIYIGLSWYTSRNIAKFLYKQDIPVRKILIYCTLFITVLTLIGTLVSVIYTYLGGELSVRFAYKAGTVFLMALSLFAYYYYSLRRDYAKTTRVPGFMALVASLVVALSVVWSISVIGSPATMRAKKIDSVRLSDISRLQQEILNRVNMTEKLPGDLSELNNVFQGYAVPSDPITKVAYGYKVIQQPTLKMNYITSKKELVSPAIFELCATFEIVRNVNERGQSVASVPTKISIDSIDPTYSAMNTYYEGDQSSFWNHGVGETCFKRIISSEMYYGK